MGEERKRGILRCRVYLFLWMESGHNLYKVSQTHHVRCASHTSNIGVISKSPNCLFVRGLPQIFLGDVLVYFPNAVTAIVDLCGSVTSELYHYRIFVIISTTCVADLMHPYHGKCEIVGTCCTAIDVLIADW